MTPAQGPRRALGLAAMGVLLTACAATPATSAGGMGGAAGATGPTGLGGSGGDTHGLKLATGGPYPFPQTRVSGACTLTTTAASGAAAAAAQAAYNAWKGSFVTATGAGGALRVVRNQNNNDTVSEGIGYGMLAAAYMGDQATFDGLWNYGQLHFDSKGLMNWHLNADGSTASDGAGSASDGDEDMIWALIMASDQWSSTTYLDGASKMIDAMLFNSFAGDGMLKPGDNWGGTNLTNPSYFAPAYYRVFAKMSDNDQWVSPIIDRNYAILASVTGTSGLVPNWTNEQSVVNQNLVIGGTTYDTGTYGYDATRTPWRIGMDYCFSGEPRALAYLTKVGGFFSGVGAPNIGDGYALSGAQKSGNKNMAFVGPAGVSGMAGFQGLQDAAFNYGATGQGDLSYFPSSLRVLTMLMMSGNFLDYTQ
jgi:endo-1,4-beta-D-glucanase Y